MRISTNVRIRFAVLLAVILALLIVFKAVGFAISVFALVIGIVFIYMYISSLKCPVCGNSLFNMADPHNRKSIGYKSVILSLLAGRCSACKSKL